MISTHGNPGVMISLPGGMGDFGLTNIYQTTQKVATGFLGLITLPLLYHGTVVSIIVATIAGILAINIGSIDLNFIPTSSVFKQLSSDKKITTRIPNSPDVIVVNNRNQGTGTGGVPVTETGVVPVRQRKDECFLPGQIVTNSNCQGNSVEVPPPPKPTEIPDVVDLPYPSLEYEEVVNMKDVTGLYENNFSDKLDLGPTKPKGKSRMVRFLDKFKDKGMIGETEKWEISDSAQSSAVKKTMIKSED